MKIKLSNRRSRLIRALLVIIPISLVGGYLLFAANADYGNYGESYTVIEPTSPEDDDLDYLAGQNFNMPITSLHLRRVGPSPTHGLLMITTNQHKIKYKGFTCANTYPCKKIETFNGSLRPRSESHGYNHINAFVCIDVPPNTDREYVLLLTVHLQARQYIPGSFEKDWMVIWGGSAPGTCASNRDGTGVIWRAADGTCGSPYTAACTLGSDVASGPYRQPSDKSGKNTGNTTGKNNTGTGGGSGGSSAKKQNDKPNNVPSSSDQGNAKQPDLDPSPFFDGKEYKSGSATDTLFGGVFSRSANGGVAGRLQAVVATIIIAGIAAGGYIWWRKHHKV